MGLVQYRVLVFLVLTFADFAFFRNVEVCLVMVVLCDADFGFLFDVSWFGLSFRWFLNL